MNPAGLVSFPEPVAHSGHLRLQKLVSSTPAATGIPYITGLPVIMLCSHEQELPAAFNVFMVLLNLIYSIGTIKIATFFSPPGRVKYPLNGHMVEKRKIIQEMKIEFLTTLINNAMKNFKITLFIAAILLSAFTAQAVSASPSKDKKKNVQQVALVIKGRVVDKETLTPLVFASVSIKETNVATVTNIDGEFLIKVPDTDTGKSLEISFLGYKNKVIPLSEMKNSGFKNIIALETAPIPIREIIVKPMMPDEIMEKVINNIDKNYPVVPNLMTGFYRETIRKNRTYVSIGEALVEIFKAPYNADMRYDGTRIYKGRKSTDVEKVDTVLFKLQGGPVTSLELDMVKNPEAILTRDAMKYYDYKLSGVIEIDGKPHFVIDFIQKPGVDIPLFMGKFYISNIQLRYF